MTKQLKTLLFISTLIAVTRAPALGSENKIDFEAGFFSLSATSQGKTGSLSGFGIYRIGYRRSISPKWDIGAGYTLLFTKFVTGDSGFGLDLNTTYFPFGASGTIEAHGEHSHLTYKEEYRPFVSVRFSQRNYQSIQTSYAGFGGSIGCEKTLTDTLSAKISARYSMLSAGQGASAKETALMGGLVMEF
jgi:hypothetical protein